jgi:flagellar motor switch protein FliN/FliY
MKNAEDSKRIAGHLGTALALALSSMTGKNFSVAAESGQEPGELEAPVVWQQSFSFDPEPSLWLVAGKDLWSAAGQLTLAAVGIDSLTDDDCRSTWQEILGQTIGGFATALTSDVRKEVVTGKGEAQSVEPAGVEWTVFSARHDESAVWYLKAAWLPSLAAQYDGPEPEQKALVAGGRTFSRTFDLLLDVALPVSVSFGKTHLQIREVLKLNTGSIVELNRLVVEPVDVIVNDCVIARGEVVVVDGNYGVRVTHLASREDRLRSGTAETSARTAVSVAGTA